MKLKKIKPLYTRIVTTMDTYVEQDVTASSGLVTDISKLKRGIKEYQRVVEVGTSVSNLKVGDWVCINPDRYAVKQFSENSVKNDLMTNQVVRYNFNVVTLDDKDYLLLDERDVEFIIEEKED